MGILGPSLRMKDDSSLVASFSPNTKAPRPGARFGAIERRPLNFGIPVIELHIAVGRVEDQDVLHAAVDLRVAGVLSAEIDPDSAIPTSRSGFSAELSYVLSVRYA